jgi:hypothetical protein
MQGCGAIVGAKLESLFERSDRPTWIAVVQSHFA